MAKFETYSQVDVALAQCPYSINICTNALGQPAFWHSLIVSKQVLIVSNETVAPLYLASLQESLSAKQCNALILPDGEAYKNQDSLFAIYNELIQKKYNRDSCILALGGGVVGDISGFAAATYQRGIAYIQIPTTLLAQVDSSVGGKTAINHPLGKNLIGSFYQPQAVVIDINTLSTLPEREFRAGLGEIIKYAVLEGGDFYHEVQDKLKKGLTSKSKELPYLVQKCCEIKARFVITDEHEQGIRALLNLGHTFAHALETYSEYRQWLHGEAVGIGLFCAAQLSFELGLINDSVVESIERLLKWAGLPHKIPKDVNLRELIQLMSLDKKVKNAQLRFVLIREPGNCYLADKIMEDDVYKALNASVEGV